MISDIFKILLYVKLRSGKYSETALSTKTNRKLQKCVEMNFACEISNYGIRFYKISHIRGWVSGHYIITLVSSQMTITNCNLTKSYLYDSWTLCQCFEIASWTLVRFKDQFKESGVETKSFVLFHDSCVLPQWFMIHFHIFSEIHDSMLTMSSVL